MLKLISTISTFLQVPNYLISTGNCEKRVAMNKLCLLIKYLFLLPLSLNKFRNYNVITLTEVFIIK